MNRSDNICVFIFIRFLRMSPERFEHLLALVGDHTSKNKQIDYESQYPHLNDW